MSKINIVDNSETSKDTVLKYGVGESEFGLVFLVVNESGQIYYSAFVVDDTKAVASELNTVKKLWPKMKLSEDNDKIVNIIPKIFKSNQNNAGSLDVKLSGTEFQVNVWKAISNLKEGSTASYEDIAKAIGNPKAIRAVASAVSNNKLAYLIPCHRVISKSGGISKYKWGGHRKVKLLTHEKALD